MYDRPFVSKLVMIALCKKWSHRAITVTHCATQVVCTIDSGVEGYGLETQ